MKAGGGGGAGVGVDNWWLEPMAMPLVGDDCAGEYEGDREGLRRRSAEISPLCLLLRLRE